MTVANLIEQLQTCDPDAEVMVATDGAPALLAETVPGVLLGSTFVALDDGPTRGAAAVCLYPEQS